MKRILFAAAAAGVLAASPAQAADLGGGCCADLEERIAELEATTARKGNRKVSLTVSGWVGHEVTWWDDGEESNVYAHGLGRTLSTNVKFTGEAVISPSWSAGYLLHLEAVDSDSLGISQSDDTGAAGGVEVLQSYWFIKSKQLGKVSVGKQSLAADNAALLVDGSGSLVAANWVAFGANSFGIRASGGGVTPITWGLAGSCRGMGGSWGDCAGVPQNGVRYDSPSLAGFSASASWGSDDYWDVAARYSGEFGGFKVAAAAAYAKTNDPSYSTTNINTTGLTAPVPTSVQVYHDDLTYIQAGLYVQHVPSGIFGLVNYGHLDGDISGLGITVIGIPFSGPQAVNTEATETWYFKGGIRQKINTLGHTVVYGEYMMVDKPEELQALVDADAIGTQGDVEATMYGAGVVQEIDAAAMSVWLKYRHYELDMPGFATDDADFVGFGGLINF